MNREELIASLEAEIMSLCQEDRLRVMEKVAEIRANRTTAPIAS